MKTCCLRGGCFTGPYHSGVGHLIKCNVEGRTYKVFGYRDKWKPYQTAVAIH